MESMPGLTLTDLRETATAPASNAGNADAAARPVRLEPPQNRTILHTSSSRRGPSVPGKRVCAASRRQNRDGARPAGRGAVEQTISKPSAGHLQVLQFSKCE
jgi:hypothetical protein